MGFQFGSVGHLDVQITLASFICVIVFIVFFDVVTGVMEYFLEGSKLYGKMIQTIYKELMLMGLVSFIVVISEGAQTTQVADSVEGVNWFEAVDFSHILLFFVTGFFVIHAFYLMRASIISGNNYKFMFGESTSDLIERIERLSSNKFSLSYLFYEFDFLPLSSLRERVEFRLVQVLFRDAYCLPEDFHFAYYLSGCFDRHALKTTRRSFATWGLLAVLALLNYLRIYLNIGFSSCGDNFISFVTVNVTTTNSTVSSSSSSGIRRNLDYHSEYSYPLHGPQTNVEITDLQSYGMSTLTEPVDEVAGYNSNTCRLNLVKLFLLAAGLLCFYCVIIVFFSRLYKLRMIRKTGLKSTDDYLDFLKFLAQEEQRIKSAITSEEVYKRELRRKNHALRVDIEYVLDADEASGESEFKVIALRVARLYGDIQDFVSNTILSIRLLIHQLSSGKTGDNQSGLLHQLKNVAETAIENENPQIEEEIRQAEEAETIRHSPRKAMLHLHRSSTNQLTNSGRESFLNHVSAQVKHGKDDILRKLTASRSSKSNIPVIPSAKVQPHSESDLPASTIGNEEHKTTFPAPRSIPPAEQKTISSESESISPGERFRASILVARFSTLKKQSPQSSPVATRKTLISTAPKINKSNLSNPRRTGDADVSATAFLNSQLNRPTFSSVPKIGINNNSSSPGKAPAVAATAPPRRGSVVLQKLNEAHVSVVDEEIGPASSPLEEDALCLFQRYEIYRRERKKQRISGTSSNSSVAPPQSASMQTRVISCIDSVSKWFASPSSSKGENLQSKDIETGEKKSEATSDDSFVLESLDDFTDVYFFGRPIWFYRAVEVCIMFNCLYFAFWMTDFLVISTLINQSTYWSVLTQLGMILPAFIVFPCIGTISETCSMIGALSALNLEVIHEVLLEAERTRLLMINLRKRMLSRIRALEQVDKDMVDTVHELFLEIDEKRNGWIDRFQFRVLLRTLKLTFSDDRFNRLYRAVDSSGDGKIEWAELYELLFGMLEEKDQGYDHHRDSITSTTSERFEMGGGGPKPPSLKISPAINAIREADEEEEEEVGSEREKESEYDSDELSEVSDEDLSSRSAFGRRDSRHSNHSSSRGGSNSGKSRHNSFTTMKSPRSSLIRPSAMKKKALKDYSNKPTSSSEEFGKGRSAKDEEQNSSLEILSASTSPATPLIQRKTVQMLIDLESHGSEEER